MKYRPITRLVLTTLVVLFASVFLMGQKAEAASLFDNKETISFGQYFDRSKEVYSMQFTVNQKNEEIQTIAQEIEQITDTKEVLANDVNSLKDRVASLDDMFVHINKYAYDSAGNTYAWGNCTFYAKSQRPDASNSWGNANTWYSRAQAQGWNVGLKAKKGAIATSTAGWLGHVAYVEKVSLDGQWVTISEMNYIGLNRVSSRLAHYTEFRYIYELN